MGSDRLQQSLASGSHGGLSFGPWGVEGELGRGAFGVVFRARHRQSGQPAAVKVIRGGAPADERDLKRFQREIALLAKLDHRSIVRVLDSGVANGAPWVALELVDGTTLRETALEVAEYAMVLARVARAVGAAHRSRVVHRDLKPANVLVEKSTGEPKVLDFGLAFDARLDASRLSRTGEISGTPAYIAPEVLRGLSGPDDPRRDVYALGVMLHERLTGEHPFVKPGSTAAVVLDHVLKGVPALAGRRGVDPLLARICDRACSSDPGKRPPDGDAFALELETWLVRSRSAAANPPARSLAVPIAVLVAVLAVAVAGVAVALLLAKTPVPVAPVPATPAPPPPTPRPAPPPPAPPVKEIRRAPEEELVALEEALGPCFQGRGSLEEVLGRGAELASRFPDDPRAELFALLRRAGTAGEEFHVRRELVRLSRVRPALPWQDYVPVGLFLRTTGFDRAACCVGEEAFPEDEERPLQVTNFQFHFHLLADDPVRDPLRAERLAQVCLSKKTDADADAYPERYLLHMAKASALIGQGDNEGAARSFEAAANASTGRTAQMLRGEARSARSGARSPETMGSHFVASFGITRFLGGVCMHETRAMNPDEVHHVHALVELGATEEAAGRPEHSALARLRAARFLRRSGKAAEARAVLEAAAAMKIEPIDARSLVLRALAHALLADAPVDAARAEELALGATQKSPLPFDPRTPCEVADAWALVGRARLERGDDAGAREAVAKARALNPRDVRELEALEARLAARPGGKR